MALAYKLNSSSLHRHRTNCLGLASSNAIKKEAARGSAAATLLPSKEALGGDLFELRDRTVEVIAQAQQQGSLSAAISGLNSLRQTLDSLIRLAAHSPASSAQEAAGARTKTTTDLDTVVERVIKAFDKEPKLKARIAQTLLEIGDE